MLAIENEINLYLFSSQKFSTIQEAESQIDCVVENLSKILSENKNIIVGRTVSLEHFWIGTENVLTVEKIADFNSNDNEITEVKATAELEYNPISKERS